MKKIFLAILLLVPTAVFADDWNVLFPDKLICGETFNGATLVLDREMIDHNGSYYGRPELHVYSNAGIYVGFEPDGNYYSDSGVTSECQYDIQDIATSTNAVFYSRPNLTRFEIYNPTQDAFYGIILLFGFFFAMVYLLNKRKEREYE